MSWCPETSSSVSGLYFSTLANGISESGEWHSLERPYHGRLSSASTGRFAALLLPFELSELNIIDSFAGGASTSISSSS